MNEISDNILPSEHIARYIFSRSHFGAKNGRVKYGALMPKRGETSVFRITNLPDNEVWQIGQNQVAEVSGRTLRARGDLSVFDVLQDSLEVEPETETHQLHANIVGWPEHKGKVILIAKKLAGKARLHLNPSGQV